MRPITIFLLIILPLSGFCDGSKEIQKLVADFYRTDEMAQTLDAYHPDVKLSEEEKIIFAFMSLEQLLDNPQRTSLVYGWKISRICWFIDNLDPDKIPLKYIPTLFKVLKTGSVVLTGDVMIIDALDRIVGNNPGYTMQYLEEGKFSAEPREKLIDKWERIFEENKEHILKKRYYKHKYFGKKVAD